MATVDSLARESTAVRVAAGSGSGGVSVQMRAQPGPVDHLLDAALRLPRVRPRTDPGSRAREGARARPELAERHRRPVGHREAPRVRRPDDERPVPSGLLGAGVRRGSVPVPAARLLRHVPLPALAHERGRNAPGPRELPAGAQRGADAGRRAAPARLRADSRADVRHRASAATSPSSSRPPIPPRGWISTSGCSSTGASWMSSSSGRSRRSRMRRGSGCRPAPSTLICSASSCRPSGSCCAAS